MHLIQYIVGFGGALFGIGFAIWHEVNWLAKRSWLHVDGMVIDIVREVSNHESLYFPKIEFMHGESRHEFVSKYGETPKVGTIVPVVYDPSTLKAERFSWANRWIFTIGPGALGIFCLWIGITASPANAEQGGDLKPDHAASRLTSQF